VSIHHVAWVLKHSQAAYGARLVLISLASHANDAHEAYPSVPTLAGESRLTDRAVQTALTRLVEADEIARSDSFSRYGTRIYQLPDPWKSSPPEESAGVKSATRIRSQTSPNTSVKPSSVGGSAPAVRIAGKHVNPEAWALTAEALGEFNAQTGRHLRLLTSAGGPSEAAKRIYGRVRDYPDLTLEDHRRIMANTLASRWWGEGRESIGVVYGPKVFEDNITRRRDVSSADGSSAPRRSSNGHDQVRERRAAALRERLAEVSG
jgi:hypothetical protein